MSRRRVSVAILGGGPGGYEAALVAAQLGALVTVVDSDGLGGAAVLTNCVPSKTLISIAADHRAARLGEVNARILRGTGRLASPTQVRAELADGSSERILTWQQIYGLTDLPQHLVVVGSGVTGAELAAAYLALGSAVTLVSSRERVLPGEDTDAATVIMDVFRRNGMDVLDRSRMSSLSTRWREPSPCTPR